MLTHVTDRQHQSRGASDFPFITHEPNAEEYRVIYQMKGNVYLYIMILSNNESRAKKCGIKSDFCTFIFCANISH